MKPQKSFKFYAIMFLCTSLSSHALKVKNRYYATIKPALSLDYKIPSKSSLEIANFFFWEIKAVCSLKIEDPEAVISAKITEKYGIVNGIKLNKEDVHDFTLYDNDKLFITAPAGSAVSLYNYSAHDIYAKCSAS